MIYLFMVAAPHRSGTQWFSRLFTLEHAFCYHELTLRLCPYPANWALENSLKEQCADHEMELTQRRVLLQAYPDYFARHWERVLDGQYIVGNSGGLAWLLPGLWLLWPNMKFIFSFRNGINCVQSHFGYAEHVSEGDVRLWRQKWGTSDFFTVCCHRWVEDAMLVHGSKKWLAGKAQLIETRLEAMTTDIAELRKVWDWVGFGQWEKYEARNRALMHNPANARTNRASVVDAAGIWESWSPEQRASFKNVCGAAMELLEYPIP